MLFMSDRCLQRLNSAASTGRRPVCRPLREIGVVERSLVPCSRRSAGKLLHELLDEQLRGEDADQGHVVLDPDRLARAGLVDQPPTASGWNTPSSAIRSRREQFFDVLRTRASLTRRRRS